MGDPQTHIALSVYRLGSPVSLPWICCAPHRFTGRSMSNSLRIDFPSMSAGMSRPAMSRMVGAKSMLRTMWGFLRRQGEQGLGHLASLGREEARGREVARDCCLQVRTSGSCYLNSQQFSCVPDSVSPHLCSLPCLLSLPTQHSAGLTATTRELCTFSATQTLGLAGSSIF